jgi:hypothetical protein
LQVAYGSNPNDDDALRAIDLLYDTALVSSGYTVSFLSFSISPADYEATAISSV